MLLATVSQYPIDLAAFVEVCLACRFAVHNGEVIFEPRHWSHGHTMRNQHNGNPALPRGQIERNAVRVAVVGRQGKVKISLTEKFEVAREITKQLDNADRFERF